MPLQTSALITRKQLACLTGGKVDGAQHTNILNVGTPFMYCGGSAIAMKQGVVHHICLKEGQNTPLPDSITKPFEVWKQRMKSGNEHCINVLAQQANPIPIFWEPKSQEGKSVVAGTSAKGVVYAGHWKINHVEDLIGKGVEKLNRERIALIRLSFVRYNHTWHEIIEECKDKTPAQIRSTYFKKKDDDKSSNKGCISCDGSENEQEVLKLLVADIIGMLKLSKKMKDLAKKHLKSIAKEANDKKKGKDVTNCSFAVPMNLSQKSSLFFRLV